MLPLTKVHSPADYTDPDYILHRGYLESVCLSLRGRGLLDEWPVPERGWEYTQALRSASRCAKKDPLCLEVGGGSSCFLPALTRLYPSGFFDTLEVPGYPNKQRVKDQCDPASIIQWEELPRGHYDMVFCLSAIENMPELKNHGDALLYVLKLGDLLSPGGILFLTSDIGEHNPDDYMFSHMRSFIWTPLLWEGLLNNVCLSSGLRPLGGDYNIKWEGPHVYGNYNFCCMALQRPL